MTVVPLLVVFSLFLAACGVALFVYSARNRDHEHADRLSLLPLEDDLPRADLTEPFSQPFSEPASEPAADLASGRREETR